MQPSNEEVISNILNPVKTLSLLLTLFESQTELEQYRMILHTNSVFLGLFE